MTNIIRKAQKFAMIAHRDQKQKYTDEPYTNHTFAVADILSGLGFSDKVVVAAILHDVIEDTTLTYGHILGDFGRDVANLVLEVTDVSKPEDGNRATRKALDRDHLAHASPDGQSIKLADLIDNSKSITAHDPNFAKVYMREKRELLGVLTKGDPRLMAEATRIVDEYFANEAK